MLGKLKILRENAGYSQRQMAKMLGYKFASGYNQIETGKRRIDLDTAKKISEIFNKPIEDIFFDHGVVSTTTSRAS